MTGDEITKDEWNALSDAQWRALLTKEWSKPFVSLSGAVHWIATGGEPREADFDELNDAALKLVHALHEKGKLTAQGIPHDGSKLNPVPSTDVLNVPAFFDDGRETEAFRDAVYLEWNQFLEGNRSDVITDRCGTIHWRDLVIDRTDMRSLWPGEDAAMELAMLPYKTGAQGRPSPIQLVERESERRRISGEACQVLTDEARWLHGWCKKSHPKIATPTAKTIENRIRDDHRNWKTAK